MFILFKVLNKYKKILIRKNLYEENKQKKILKISILNLFLFFFIILNLKLGESGDH